MTEGNIVRLGDVLAIQNGFAFDSKRFGSVGTPLVRIRDLKNGRTTETRYDGEYDARYVVRSGDLLIGMDGEFRVYQWQGGDALLNQRVCRLEEFDSNVILQDYLRYALDVHLKEVEDHTGFTTVKHLSAKTVLDLRVPLPPLHEQKRIVAKMDAVAERHAALLQVNAALESEARALRTRFVDSLIGEVETKAPLADLCDVFVDGDWVESKDQSPQGIRLVQTGNVGSGFFKANDERARFISEDTFARLRCTEVLPGDCLVSRLPEPVGRACVVPDIGSRMITAVDCTLIRTSSRLLPEYFVFVTQSSQYAAQIRERSTGSTRTRVSRKNLGQVLIPVPRIDEQEAIVRRLKDVDTKISALLHLSESRRDLADGFTSGLLSDLIGAGL